MLSYGARVKVKVCWLPSWRAFYFAMLLGSAWAHQRGVSPPSIRSSRAVFPAHSSASTIQIFNCCLKGRVIYNPKSILAEKKRRASKYIPPGDHIMLSLWFLLQMLRDKHGSKYAILFSSLNILFKLIRSVTSSLLLFHVREWVTLPPTQPPPLKVMLLEGHFGSCSSHWEERGGSWKGLGTVLVWQRVQLHIWCLIA